MSTVMPGPPGPPGPVEDLADPIHAVARAFKAAIAARRRMRGRETQRPGELSDAQYGLLYCLRTASPMSSSELALAADLSPASTTEMLEGLEHVGLVQRTRSTTDRRVVLTTLTTRGGELVDRRHAQFEPRLRAALGDFSAEELLTAASVLRRLQRLYDERADATVS